MAQHGLQQRVLKGRAELTRLSELLPSGTSRAIFEQLARTAVPLWKSKRCASRPFMPSDHPTAFAVALVDVLCARATEGVDKARCICARHGTVSRPWARALLRSSVAFHAADDGGRGRERRVGLQVTTPSKTTYYVVELYCEKGDRQVYVPARIEQLTRLNETLKLAHLPFVWTGGSSRCPATSQLDVAVACGDWAAHDALSALDRLERRWARL